MHSLYYKSEIMNKFLNLLFLYSLNSAEQNYKKNLINYIKNLLILLLDRSHIWLD